MAKRKGETERLDAAIWRPSSLIGIELKIRIKDPKFWKRKKLEGKFLIFFSVNFTF